MSTLNSKNSGILPNGTQTAKKRHIQVFSVETPGSSSYKGGGDSSPAPTAAEVLQPKLPDPSKGFQPISDHLKERLTKATMAHMRQLCSERKITLDFKYWKHCTRTILGQPSTDNAIVVPAPAGSGKSTWIEAFTGTVTELFHADPELATALVGVVLVLQKVEDLNRLAEVLNANAPGDNPNMVALQGWTQSGQKQGFCRNAGIQRFEDCSPSDCPYSQRCKLLAFRNFAPMAPVVGLTQERFAMLRDSGNLGSVLNRMVGENTFLPRRFLIFDEKFQFAQVNTLSKDTIDQASMEITQLIAKRGIADWQAKSLQKQLSYLIDRPFQELRGKQKVPAQDRDKEIMAGFCSLNYIELHQDLPYESFRSFVLNDRPQFATKHLREAFAVMDSLHAGNSCLFSKGDGFAITSITPPIETFGQSQAIIFDATAEVDDDYKNLKHFQFFRDVPDRDTCCVEYYIFTHKDLNVSKRAMTAPWKIQSFSKLIKELADAEDMFICTYKDFAEPFVDELKETMSPEQFRHVLLKEGCEKPTLPYLGGTNGSNSFNTARQVFMVGYPRLKPRDYLINTCAAYGTEQIAQELGAISQKELTTENRGILYSLPSMQRYIAHHLAARLEQEIYRCALRNPNFTGCIRIYLFCPPEDMLRILLERIPGEVVYQPELPACVRLCKDCARRYKDGDTSFEKLVIFLNTWDGSPIRVSALRKQLGISPAVWKDLRSDPRVRDLFEQYGVIESGRGKNATLLIERRRCA